MLPSDAGQIMYHHLKTSLGNMRTPGTYITPNQNSFLFMDNIAFEKLIRDTYMLSFKTFI